MDLLQALVCDKDYFFQISLFNFFAKTLFLAALKNQVSLVWHNVREEQLGTECHLWTFEGQACMITLEGTSVVRVSSFQGIWGLWGLVLKRGLWSDNTWTVSLPRMQCSNGSAAKTIAKHSFSISNSFFLSQLVHEKHKHLVVHPGWGQRQGWRKSCRTWWWLLCWHQK